MGSVFFTGQTIRYVGSTPLTVSETVLSAAPNVNTMFSGEDPNAPGLIKYVPGLPDFLQGFTKFVPGSTYMVFTRGLSVLPLSAPSTVDFIPYTTADEENDALVLKSGVSFFTSTSSGSPNIFTGTGVVTSAFAVISASNYVNKIFRVTPNDANINPLYAQYGPGLPEFLQGFTLLEQNSSYIAFFQNQALSAGSALEGFFPLEIYNSEATPTPTPTRTSYKNTYSNAY